MDGIAVSSTRGLPWPSGRLLLSERVASTDSQAVPALATTNRCPCNWGSDVQQRKHVVAIKEDADG